MDRNKKDNENKKAATNNALKPDPETLHTTDPQKNMEGPLSSLMHQTGEKFDSDKTQEEADEERDHHM